MPEKSYKKKHLTSFQLIILGVAGVILLGTFLLMLPVSSLERVPTPFHEALFTATSAVCVTGLVVKDTGSYWSLTGQTIILVLIQIGGLGVVTVAASVSLLSGKKISLMQRSTMQDAISAPKVGGIVRLTRFILKGTFLIEATGAVLLLPAFLSDYGVKGIWLAVFHSISAFCNAGFDILGTATHTFSSLMRYSGSILVNVVIMLLIITGGIGFLTWDDIYTNKLNFKRYRMQSKIILMTTACLILLPAVFFFSCDLKKMSTGKRLLAAIFQSVTTRTAGFNTINISKMSETSKAVMILLMLIGGSPGSTAGGMKTTTFTVLILNAIATFRSQENAGAFGRRLEYHVIKNAATIAMLYFTLFFCGGIAISVYEGLPLLDCLYEAASAVGTVGLTLGITPGLHIFSQVVLIILMYLGRVGGLTLIYAVFSGRNKGNARLPLEKITVG
nr:potassium transporter TrkG [uncultured Blautia sp.]